ncbi:hypothetical protein AKJ41_04300 [candidate division MSBL1 archaeon SCGC-AAA259O05]|uniref:Uncharacterized protein n=1 Tax=candidate division MSBL1 archaeon SCGC-AAA259O05 TaxID=1698271 RepID=A0A133V192_9EURY|nr:hypothetical protein AKJ41_04300 [candidate division MSBL1 archaeon SCGC-AAA259O05]
MAKWCVCGHELSVHIDEGDGWRCHLLGPGGFQCECYLRKDRADGDIEFYSLERRKERFLEELEKVKELEI